MCIFIRFKTLKQKRARAHKNTQMRCGVRTNRVKTDRTQMFQWRETDDASEQLAEKRDSETAETNAASAPAARHRCQWWRRRPNRRRPNANRPSPPLPVVRHGRRNHAVAVWAFSVQITIIVITTPPRQRRRTLSQDNLNFVFRDQLFTYHHYQPRFQLRYQLLLWLCWYYRGTIVKCSKSSSRHFDENQIVAHRCR